MANKRERVHASTAQNYILVLKNVEIALNQNEKERRA